MDIAEVKREIKRLEETMAYFDRTFIKAKHEHPTQQVEELNRLRNKLIELENEKTNLRPVNKRTSR